MDILRTTAQRLRKAFKARRRGAGRLPDFIIGGFPKCGTTSIMRNLGQHPDIHIPPHEVRYFNKDRLTLEEYRALFSSDKQRTGEKTPSYYYQAATMQKMHACLPRAKLVVCIRHPIHMLHSFYHFRVQSHGQEPPGFDRQAHPFARIILEQMAINGVSEEAADYARHLRENVLPLYGRGQLLFVIQERLVDKPQEQYQRLLQWLDVSPQPIHSKVINSHASGSAWYPSIDYSSAQYRRALAGLLERYEPRIQATRELLGESIPEWHAFDHFYREIAGGKRPASPQLGIPTG